MARVASVVDADVLAAMPHDVVALLDEVDVHSVEPAMCSPRRSQPVLASGSPR